MAQRRPYKQYTRKELAPFSEFERLHAASVALRDAYRAFATALHAYHTLGRQIAPGFPHLRVAELLHTDCNRVRRGLTGETFSDPVFLGRIADTAMEIAAANHADPRHTVKVAAEPPRTAVTAIPQLRAEVAERYRTGRAG